MTQTLIGKRNGIFYVYVQLNLGYFSSRPEICEHETGLVQQPAGAASLISAGARRLTFPRICVTMKLVAARCQKIFMDSIIPIVLFQFGNL